nr:carbon-nitrogen hydrolase family protein [Sulfitobacter algicola]
MIQLNSGDDPTVNIVSTQEFLREASGSGAQFILTPEVTNCVSTSRDHQNKVLCPENEDQTLFALRQQADTLNVWLLIGSLAIKTNDPDGRFANRSFLISPKGEVVARYDKIHMFDVQISESETYQESKGYRPGSKAVLAQTPFARIGMTICYDLRFPHLYRTLAQAGADILTVPSAFSSITGQAHWHSLLRARAIETGCFVLAPAQTGQHPGRRTFGHSLAISPWGDILVDAGTKAGISLVDLHMEDVAKARKRIASLSHDRPFEGPE